MKASSPTSFERMSPGGGASTITTTMLATTPTTSSTVSTPLSSPMYFLPATSPADQQRAIAAAAAAALARRKRRKALARRSLRNRQVRYLSFVRSFVRASHAALLANAFAVNERATTEAAYLIVTKRNNSRSISRPFLSKQKRNTHRRMRIYYIL